MVADKPGVHFSEGETAWEKTDVMSFDQVMNAFYKEFPPYSMLFGTGGKPSNVTKGLFTVIFS